MRTQLRFVPGGLAAAAVTGAAWGQPLDLCRTWAGNEPSGHGPMVYDQRRGEVVLLAANVECCRYPMETWVLRGDRWKRVSDATPFGPDTTPFRTGAYDAARSRFVAASLYGEELRMAEWDGERWTLLRNVRHGLLNAEIRLAYDPVRGETLLVLMQPDRMRILAWDGAALHERSNTPSLFVGGWVAFDESRGVLVIFNESSADGGFALTLEWDGTSLALRRQEPRQPQTRGLFYDPGEQRVRRAYDRSLRSWTGSAWTEAVEVGAEMADGARGDFSSCAFDPARGAIVAVHAFGGGITSTPSVADSFLFDGAAWRPLNDWYLRKPAQYEAGAYDEARAIGVLLGDRDVGSSTRTWDGENYGDLPGYDPRPRAPLPLCVHPDGRRAGQFIPNSAAWTFQGGSWSSLLREQIPGSTDYSVVYDSDRHVVWAMGARMLGFTRFKMFDGQVWTDMPAAVPGNRTRMGATYDSWRHQVLVFGGQGTAVNQQLVAWDGASWTQIFNGGPAFRVAPAFVFDPDRGVAVLFGGQGRSPLNDTWEWNGAAWTQVPTPHSPAGGALTSVAYLPAAHRVCVATNPASGPSQLWAYDGADWEQVSTAPGLIVSMAWHPQDGVLLAELRLPGEYALVTYTWDGAAWARRSRPSPNTFNNGEAFYDPDRQRLCFLSVESAGNNHLNELWQHDGEAWTRIDLTGPEYRYKPAVCYDRARGAIVMFGGEGFNAQSGGFTLGDTWTWTQAGGWTRSNTAGPAPRYAARMAFDERRGVCVMFGGYLGSPSSPTNETWEWNGAEWRQGPTTGDLPHVRADPAIVYDPSLARIILGAGEEPGSQAGEDAWVYDGAWRPVQATSVPLRLSAPASWFDRRRNVMVTAVSGVDLAWMLREFTSNAARVELAATDVAVYQGRQIRFSAIIRGGAAATLRWRRDGADLIDDDRIHGATTGELTIDDARLADAGVYQLVASTCEGEVSTSAAALVKCLADFNQDGFVDFFDYDDFLLCFEDGLCPGSGSADLNGDAFGDFFDYTEFVQAFEAGCT